MQRREFITLIGGLASALPFSAMAQPVRKWRIGFLHPGQSVTVNNRIGAFREGLGAPGPGEAPEIVVRIANERLDQLPAMAADLVGQNVQAICAVAPPAVRAARDATSSIPIIAMDLESDPVGNGWATSLAHPGGNITGIFLDLPDFSAKTLQLLREAVPNAARIAGLWHPASGSLQLKAVQKAAVALGVEFDVFEVNRVADFEAAFRAMSQKSVAGLLMLSSPIFAGNPQLLADLAIRNRLPAINNFPDFAQNGGLIGYGPDLQSLFAQAGLLTRKVMQGSAIADLPVERPTRFKLIVNLKTARTLGVTMPTSLLLLADEVIE
jgi:putative tryptophan/tyrosine transport system substrate-binding protein